MPPPMKLRLARTVSLVLTLAILCSAPRSLSSKSQPRISWSGERIEITLSPGEMKVRGISFTSNQDLQNITLEPVPALARFLSLQPNSFTNITGGQQMPVLLTFSIPVGTKFGSYDGTIHVRSGKKTLPQTLKVVIHVQEATPPSTKFSLFNNPADPLVLRAVTPAGEVFEYFGTKDERGLATALTSIRIEDANGDVTQILLDEQSRPTQILAFNGVVFKIAWLSNTNILVTAISPDGSVQVNVAVDLTAQITAAQKCSSCSSAPAAKSSNSGSPPTAARASGPARKAVVTPAKRKADTFLKKTTTLQSVAQASSSTSLVNVTRCGQPVDDANVIMRVVPQSVAKTYSVPGTLVGPGQYSVSIPIEPSSLQILEDYCLSTAGIFATPCELASAIPVGVELLICASIARAVTILGFPVAAGAILIACEKSFIWFRGYCTFPGYSPAPSAPSLAEFFCENITEIADRFFGEDLFLSPFVFIPGEGVVASTTGQPAPASGPFPTFNVAVPGNVEIESFTTTPADPAPFQGYIADALISCAPPGTFVNISIQGTDGYFDLETVIISSDAHVQLFVPGAAEGIVDTITVQVVGGPTRHIVLVF